MNSSPAVSNSNREDYLGYLDGLRGGAAFWVLFAHCLIWGGWNGWHVPSPKHAVDIFMVISGYLMAYHYMAREKREPVNSWQTARKFWVRRFFRIAPLYYTVLVAVFLLGPAMREGRSILYHANLSYWSQNPGHDPNEIQFTAMNFFTHVTFLFGFIPQYARSTLLPDWSIGLEMQFYAAFPLLFLLLRRFGYLAFALAGLVVTVAIKRWLAGMPGINLETNSVFPEPSFLLMKLPLFLIGMLAAESHQSFSRTLLQRTFAVLIAILMASRQSIYVLLATAVMIYLGAAASNSERDGIFRWQKLLNGVLGNRFTLFMADTSYSVYLIHSFFITLAGGWLFGQARFLQLTPMMRVMVLTPIVIVCTYVTAYALHRWIEKPGINFGRNLIKKMGRKNVPMTSPPLQPAAVPTKVD